MENTRKIAASLTCHFCFRKQHCKNFLLTSMRVCPFLIIIYTGVSSGSNMSYEPEPERYEWKTVSGKRLPFSLIRIMRCIQADYFYVIVWYVADCIVQKVKNDDGNSAYYGSTACAELWKWFRRSVGRFGLNIRWYIFVIILYAVQELHTIWWQLIQNIYLIIIMCRQ